MIVDDPIYGQSLLDSPTILAAIESDAVQRLKGVLQHGITALLGISQPVTRFDHSLGVMLLVRRLGGSPQEQLAALLHDVSHTAFSHVMDHVFDSAGSQSFHDHVQAEYVAGSDLPALLAGLGIDWQDLLDEERYPLLEQPAPALCADRLDYSLRDAVELGLLTPADIQHILDHLVVHQGRIVMDDVDAALLLADAYLQADDASWANWREVGLYEVTANAIRRGMEVGAIGDKDIWGTDEVVWQKLLQHEDAELQRRVALVHPDTGFVWDEANPDFWVSTKLRTIDPDVLQDGECCPLSTWLPAYGERRQAYLARKQGPWPMRVIHPANSQSL